MPGRDTIRPDNAHWLNIISFLLPPIPALHLFHDQIPLELAPLATAPAMYGAAKAASIALTLPNGSSSHEIRSNADAPAPQP